jgi:hypothetical protein
LTLFDDYPQCPFGDSHPWVLELGGWGIKGDSMEASITDDGGPGDDGDGPAAGGGPGDGRRSNKRFTSAPGGSATSLEGMLGT